MNRTDLALRIFGITTTRDPAVAAALGYPNPGTDLRVAGDLGRLIARLQARASFKSATPPALGPVETLGDDVYLQVATAPNGRQHVTIAVRQRDGRWFVVRAGWRYDPNWGDARSVGYDPDPSIVGGYIFDVVIKMNQPRSHVEGVE